MKLSSKPMLGLLAPLLFIGIALPCVPDGGSGTVTLPRPRLPSAPPNAPGGSSWSSDAPAAEEHDDASPNDPMGDATPSSDGNSASVPVTNTGGNLQGPNGVTQNGGAEGDCIEVAICWKYWTWTRHVMFQSTDTGFEIQYYWLYEELEVCNGGNDVEVCPC